MLVALLAGVVTLNVWADFMDRRAALSSDIDALSLWTTIAQFLLIAPLLGMVMPLPPVLLAYCAAIGAFSAIARNAWYHALSHAKERLSGLAPFSRVSSVISLIFAFTVLHEPFAPLAAIGALVMIIGAFMLSLRGKPVNFAQYFRESRALLLVLIFAASSAFISIFYKFALLDGAGVVSIYFYLKVFQCAFAVALAAAQGRVTASYSAIVDLPLFVQARAMQTIAALAYIFALQNAHLSTVTPITAVLSPLLYLAFEKFQDRKHAAPTPASRTFVETVGLVGIVAGTALLIGGRT